MLFLAIVEIAAGWIMMIKKKKKKEATKEKITS